MRTIRQQLLIGLMSGMVITILAVGIGSYLKVRHETNELFDYQLKQIVRSFPANMTFQQSETADKHPGKKIVVQVFELAYHPQYQWLITDMPDDYKIPTNMLPGITASQLSAQLRKLYLFRKGEPTAEKLTPQKRNELLLQILESLEPREAEVILGIFNKDLGVKGLNYKLVKEAFPNLLP